MQLGIHPALGQQFGMGAGLHDTPLLHHQDHVGIFDGGQAMGDHQRRAILHHGFQGRLDIVFRLIVQRAGGFIQKIEGGWTDVDVIIAMPTVMAKLGKIGRILGPRGLMPNPKTGTVTMDIAGAVNEVKGGKIAFRVDKFGIIHSSIGRVGFTADKIRENANEFLSNILKLKPSSAKGTYIKSISMASTMSPGINIDPRVVR